MYLVAILTFLGSGKMMVL